MKLDVKALAITTSLLWGGLVFLVGLGNVVWPGYGDSFLQGVASIYPGFEVTGLIGDVVIGTVYAMLDGFVGGLVLAWLYNLLRRKAARQAQP